MSISKNNSGLVATKLDRKDYLILNELLINSDITSNDISKKLKIPLSTVQRRRTALEHSTLIKKSYQLDAKQFGWRIADILIAVERGDCVGIANRLLTEDIGIRRSSDISKKINKINDGSYGPRVIETSLRIGDPAVNVMARVIYRTSDELFHIIQEI
jgi:DNA-binding Lrp family transcriptional regulator